MKTSLYLLCCLVFLACKNSKQLVAQKKSNEDSMIQMGRIATLSDSSDAITIEDAQISGNTLLLKVSYGGGCMTHEFDLVGRSEIAKSLPPIRSIQLLHQANKDACRALIVKELKFDLSPFALKKEAGSAIYLQLAGWEEKILYTYQ